MGRELLNLILAALQARRLTIDHIDKYAKTEEEKEAEAEAEEARQLRAIAAEQAVKTTGKVIEEGAKQQAAPAVQPAA